MLEPTRPSVPRFSGAQLLRANLGDGYLTGLSSPFGVGIKDLCVY